MKEPDPFATINEKPKQLYYVCTMRMHVYPSRPVPVIIRQTPPHMSDRRRPPTHPDEPTARRSALARPPHRSQATIPNRHPCTPPTTCTSALSLSLDRPDSLRERETAESAYSAVSRLRAGRSPSRLTPLQSPLVCLLVQIEHLDALVGRTRGEPAAIEIVGDIIDRLFMTGLAVLNPCLLVLTLHSNSARLATCRRSRFPAAHELKLGDNL